MFLFAKLFSVSLVLFLCLWKAFDAHVWSTWKQGDSWWHPVAFDMRNECETEMCLVQLDLASQKKIFEWSDLISKIHAERIWNWQCYQKDFFRCVTKTLFSEIFRNSLSQVIFKEMGRQRCLFCIPALFPKICSYKIVLRFLSFLWQKFWRSR